MSRDRLSAEAFAARVLAWLAEDAARIDIFLAWSGETPDSLGQRVNDPAILLATLDFLVLDEAMLMAACRDLGEDFTRPMQARAQIPGGDAPHWT